MSGVLDGRRVLITGASSGIGAATARAVVAAGGRVALLSRRADALESLAGELGELAGEARDLAEPGSAELGPADSGLAAVAVPCDITSATDVEAAVRAAADRLGGIDAVVNAAGRFTVGPVADTDPETWRAMFEVNVLGLLTVVRSAVPHLRQGRAAAVVNVSSMSGRRVPNPSSGVYAATKFAVHALGEALRLELNRDGIRVCTVAPGLVDTPLTEAWPDNEYTRNFQDRLREDGLSASAVADAVVHVLGTPPDVNVVEYAVMSIRQ